jgi:ubiquinone/menaquinone biosynthesis C-methylase UbiE
LTAAIIEHCKPRSIVAIDPSEGFIARARANVKDDRATFAVGDAQDLRIANSSRDVAASALVLNFVADRGKALAEMARSLRPGGKLGFYVWDYPGGGIQFMRAFWQAATALDSSAENLTEDRRFPFCTAEALSELAREAGLERVCSTALTVPTRFENFADFWEPFTLGAGPAPGYCLSLDPAARQRLKEKLESTLPRDSDGSISLAARAWGIKATVG